VRESGIACMVASGGARPVFLRGDCCYRLRVVEGV
jgi:hypothetical protein